MQIQIGISSSTGWPRNRNAPPNGIDVSLIVLEKFYGFRIVIGIKRESRGSRIRANRVRKWELRYPQPGPNSLRTLVIQ